MNGSVDGLLPSRGLCPPVHFSCDQAVEFLQRKFIQELSEEPFVETFTTKMKRGLVDLTLFFVLFYFLISNM